MNLKLIVHRVSVLGLSALLLAVPALADDHAIDSVTKLQTRWADATYGPPGKPRVTALEEILAEARVAVAEQPEIAPVHIWHGIVASSLAGEDGGLGALGLVREARKAFTAAIELDEQALSGAAYTSLGALYHKVPGWPIAFGSDKKARRYLELGWQFNPQGIDANYFLGEFLLDEGDAEAARRYLEAALAAPDRTGRESADVGRRAEVRALLAQIAK